MRDHITAGLVALALSLGLAPPACRSQSSQPYKDGHAAIARGDCTTALRLWRPLAEQGDATAQFNLGGMYEDGQGVPEDSFEPAKWYRKAGAPAGFLAHGLGGDEAYYEWLSRAVAKSAAEICEAAEQGDPSAQVKLGDYLYRGPRDSTEVANSTEAAKWYRKAAEQGNPEAQVNLGDMYEKGLGGVPHDYVQAYMWYTLAASRCSSWKDFMARQAVKRRDRVAAKYMTPGQIPEGQRLASEWYRKAAERGDATARYNLGDMYVEGLGVPKDYVQAYKWFTLADHVSLASQLVALMTPAQIAEAERLAREWKPTK